MHYCSQSDPSQIILFCYHCWYPSRFLYQPYKKFSASSVPGSDLASSPHSQSYTLSFIHIYHFCFPQNIYEFLWSLLDVKSPICPWSIPKLCFPFPLPSSFLFRLQVLGYTYFLQETMFLLTLPVVPSTDLDISLFLCYPYSQLISSTGLWALWTDTMSILLPQCLL